MGFDVVERASWAAAISRRPWAEDGVADVAGMTVHRTETWKGYAQPSPGLSRGRSGFGRALARPVDAVRSSALVRLESAGLLPSTTPVPLDRPRHWRSVDNWSAGRRCDRVTPASAGANCRLLDEARAIRIPLATR